MQVVDGVWWLRGTRGSNVYAVRLGDRSIALVDSGGAGNALAIEEGLRAAGLDPSAVRALLLTHHHWDHAGSAAALRERFDLRVIAGAGDVEDGRLRQHMRWRGRRRGVAPVVVDAVVPMDGDSEPLPGVIAIPAPGHTAGSLCYLLPDRELMLIGDVALHSGDRMSRPLTISNHDTAAQERSLRAIAERSPRHGAPGHGDPLTEQFREWMLELASKPPASGPWFLRVLLNPRRIWRFMRRGAGRA